MSSSNPYHTLFVSKNATPEQIKRAYKEQASKAHPDKGGNVSQFQEVNAAYALLSDETRRGEYDATGRTDVGQDERGQMLGELASLLLLIIDQVPDVTQIDLVAQMRTHVVRAQAQHRGSIENAKVQLEKRKAVVLRFTNVNLEDNLIAQMLQRDVIGRESVLRDMAAALDRSEKLLKVLEDYEYRIDEVRQSTPWTGGVTTTTTTYYR